MPGAPGLPESEPALPPTTRGRDLVGPAEVGSEEALSDAALVHHICAGDPASFEVLYQRYVSTCLGLSRRIVVDPALAEDVVQVAFLTVWEQADRFRPALGSVRAWLLAITHHKAVDLVRMQERNGTQRLPDAWLDNAIDTGVLPHDRAESNQQTRRAVAAIAQLRYIHREALMLCYYGGFTQSEAAARLDVPLGTVKSRCVVALRQLREALDPQPTELSA